MVGKEDSDVNRRNILRKAGFGIASSGVLLSAAGSAQAKENASENATEYEFTEEEKDAVVAELNRIARQEIRKELDDDGVVTPNWPSWIPGVPTGLPFNWCVDIPLGDEFCALANNPVTEMPLSCGDVNFTGRRVGMTLGYGPSVHIDDGEVEGDIQYQIGFNAMINEANGCFYLELTSTGQKACVVTKCPDMPDPREVSIRELAQALYDLSYSFAEDLYDAAGISPPGVLLILTAIGIAVAFATMAATPPIPGAIP
ncbi:SH2 domain-containing protein [Natrinema pallidum]|uniref:Uncharacterized protein n=1 Tax=Natrinema pallidum DSM 3751 TaxID=1227495 RepID=L9Z1A4_9EURY|nr:hypothetical protein [Natrinema pallidum]ELY78938.1 hypothetical protein C487_06920 [Natrinema pallidum DSM 3751]